MEPSSEQPFEMKARTFEAPLLRYFRALCRAQLVALGAHAEMRQARLFEGRVAERLGERAERGEQAAPVRVAEHHRRQRPIRPGAMLRFPPGVLVALREVLLELLRRRLGF